MSKQEEILKWVADYCQMLREEGQIHKPRFTPESDARDFLMQLADKGVALKVEKAQPKNPYPEVEKGQGRSRHYARVRHYTYDEAQQDMLKVGFVPVEPLI